MSTNPLAHTQSTVRIELRGLEHRLLVDFSLAGRASPRGRLILRTALSVLAREEHRIAGLTDEQVAGELAAFTAPQCA